MKCPTRMQHDVCHDCHGFSAAMQACEEGIPLASDLGASVNDAAKPCIHHELIIPRCLSECRSIHALAVQLNRKLCCSHCFVELIVAECLRQNPQTCIRNELIIPVCLSKFSSIPNGMRPLELQAEMQVKDWNRDVITCSACISSC